MSLDPIGSVGCEAPDRLPVRDDMCSARKIIKMTPVAFQPYESGRHLWGSLRRDHWWCVQKKRICAGMAFALGATPEASAVGRAGHFSACSARPAGHERSRRDLAGHVWALVRAWLNGCPIPQRFRASHACFARIWGCSFFAPFEVYRCAGIRAVARSFRHGDGDGHPRLAVFARRARQHFFDKTGGAMLSQRLARPRPERGRPCEQARAVDTTAALGRHRRLRIHADVTQVGGGLNAGSSVSSAIVRDLAPVATPRLG